MHQTTVRFGSDLWEALEEECARLGVSVAQYLREAALTRLVYAAGRRGDEAFERALRLVATPAETPAPTVAEVPWDGDPAADSDDDSRLRRLRERTRREAAEVAAVSAQGKLARERAQQLRARSARTRAR